MSFLYRYECKGIQSWILATDRLKEIRGGSQIIEDLAESVRARFRDGGAFYRRGRVLSAAAGNALIEFNDAKAMAEFASRWPMEVALRAPGITLAQNWTEGTDSDALKRVFVGMHRDRMSGSPNLPVAGPFIARSGHTGLPAASHAPDTKGMPADASTLAKLKSAEGTRHTYDRFAPEGQQFLNATDGIGKGYLAVVHIDGAGIGQRLLLLESGAEHEEFSTALTEACDEALTRAVREWATEYDAGSSTEPAPLPMRIVVAGGDDLTVILAGERAMDFVRSYLRAFEEATGDDSRGGHAKSRRERLRVAPGGTLTASAGIAFVKQRWPYRDAQDLAEDLCKAAKKPFRLLDTVPSAVLFHRVTTSLAADWEQVRATELCAAERGEGALSGGPYTLRTTPGATSVDALVAVQHALAGVPRGPVRSWLREAGLSADHATSSWSRATKVRKGSVPHDALKLEKALEAASPWPSLPAESPWHAYKSPDKKGGEQIKQRTALGDALTLLAVAGAGEYEREETDATAAGVR